mmetsp:Transcript_31575/g.48432  ORF Transcript_31575/g.48432 Transcript_31575/m.48432 type:complete len:384 (-) Transcript_31575:723-1874(-)
MNFFLSILFTACVASGSETSIDKTMNEFLDKGHSMNAPRKTRSLKTTKAITLKGKKGSGKKGSGKKAPPRDLVAFGDSLSDTGNANQKYPCTTLSFCGDRFSNGPVVLEIIATQLGIAVSPAYSPGGNNFAFAGARATPNEGSDFEKQMLDYENQLTSSLTITPETLYFIMLGGNDVIQAVLGERENEGEAIAVAIDAMKTNIQRLIDLGACSLLIFGSVDVGLTPLYHSNAYPQARPLSELFNTELEDMVHDLEDEVSDSGNCLGIKYVDFLDVIDEVLSDDDFAEEFPDVTAVCNNRFVIEAPCTPPSCPYPHLEVPVPSCSEGDCCRCAFAVLPEDDIKMEPTDCAGQVFYDELHPTTQFNNYVADAVLERIGEFLQLDY